MDIDKLAMITLLIIYILFTVIALFTYLIVIGGNENKTENERRLEDEEQMKILKNLKNKRKKVGNRWKK